MVPSGASGRVLVLCCVTLVPAAGHLASSQVRALPPPGTCHHRTIEAVTRDTRTATEEEGFKVKVPSSGHKGTRLGPAPAGQGSVNSGHLTGASPHAE